MNDSALPAGPHDPADRMDAIRRLIDERNRERNGGARVTDRQLVHTHPHLLPELRAALRAERDIRRAIREARRLGPVAPNDGGERPIHILTETELLAPIRVSETASSNDGHAHVPTGGTPAIDGYRIAAALGAGGQAVVYKAIQESTGRPVAIKVLAGGAEATSRQRERFNRESTILATLDHPNIVPILDRGRSDDGSFYFAMPLYTGDEFDVHVARLRERGDIKGIAALFARICDAVGDAHRRGVVHRDLKPSNILLNERGDPFVVDFGLARPEDDFNSDEWARVSLTRDGQILGSLPWASPEQVSSDTTGRTVGVRADVYSLGVMLYHGLTGQFPYAVHGPTISAVANILNARAARPSRVMKSTGQLSPHVIDNVVLRCLEKDPALRYTDGAELGGDLDRLVAGRTTTPSPRIVRSKRRVRLALMTIAAALLVAVASWIVLTREPVVEVIQLPSFANSIGMRMLRIPAGVVITGSPRDEDGRDGGEVLRTFKIERPFFLAATEVTVGQYRQVMGSVPAGGNDEDNLPLRQVSHADALEFCRRLSASESGRIYRLPDEAEWEYACRAGTKGAYGGTTRLASMGWYRENSRNTPQEVGTKSPNHWGLHDMHGNVSEWCGAGFPDEAPTSQSKPIRGGSYMHSAAECRSAARAASIGSPWVGFRVVCEDPS